MCNLNPEPHYLSSCIKPGCDMPAAVSNAKSSFLLSKSIQLGCRAVTGGDRVYNEQLCHLVQLCHLAQ